MRSALALRVLRWQVCKCKKGKGWGSVYGVWLWGFTRVSVQTALERVVKWTREKERVLVKKHTWRVGKSPYEEKYSLVLLLEAAVLFQVLSPKTRPQQWDR